MMQLTARMSIQSLKDSATKAGTNISKIADNMSSWWANLDPVQKGSPSPEGHGGRPVAAEVCYKDASQRKTWSKKGKLCCIPWKDCHLLACEQDADKIQELFGFSEEEEVMESFEVKLRQTLSCTHNTFTTPQEVKTGCLCCILLTSSKR